MGWVNLLKIVVNAQCLDFFCAICAIYAICGSTWLKMESAISYE